MKKQLVSVAAVAAVSTAFAADASAAGTYQVKSGDSLSKIAAKFKTSVPQLMKLNGLKSDFILAGQTLKVAAQPSPVKKPVASKPKPEAKPVATKPVSKPIASVPKPQPAPASSKLYTVRSGDSLSRIANQFKVSIQELKQWNQLSSDMIKIGQKLKVAGTGAAAQKPVQAPADKTPSNQGQSSYEVKSGDTLGAIALRFGMSVEDLKQLNGLAKDIIYIGQALLVNGQAGSAPDISAPADSDSVNLGSLIETAMNAVGTPYVWAGATPAGFDCSGFIYYAFNEAGKKVNRLSTEGYFDRAYFVNNPKPGDLVFFENTYKKGISHMGIYIGNGQFIHAGDNGVQISSTNEKYWKDRLVGYKQFY